MYKRLSVVTYAGAILKLWTKEENEFMLSLEVVVYISLDSVINWCFCMWIVGAGELTCLFWLKQGLALNLAVVLAQHEMRDDIVRFP